jgi:hypothetical protein
VGSRQSKHTFQWLLLVLAFIAISVNSVMLLRVLDMVKFPSEITEMEIVRGGARAIVDYYEGVAEAAGLSSNAAVRDVLARLRFEVEEASSSNDLVRVITQYFGSVKDVVEREQENKRRNRIFQIITEDETVQAFSGTATVTVQNASGREVSVDDPLNALSPETLARLSHDPDALSLTSIVEIQITDGKCTILASRSLEDRLNILRTQNNSLRASLEETRRAAGLSQLTGAGVKVRVFGLVDEGLGGGQIQERDIRDIVNELRVAGAIGIEVGGERLIVSSYIRASGSQILVNGRSIPLNPVEIKAIGNPEILQSSLELIKNSLGHWGITVEVTQEESLTLRAYREV